MSNEVYDFIRSVSNTFVSEIRGDDYDKWPIEHGIYFFSCLKEVKPDVAEAIDSTVIDPRNRGVTDALIEYLYSFWNYDYKK